MKERTRKLIYQSAVELNTALGIPRPTAENIYERVSIRETSPPPRADALTALDHLVDGGRLVRHGDEYWTPK